MLAVLRRPAISLVLTTAVLLALAAPVLGLRIGAAGTSSLPNDTVAKQGLLALQRDFPRGATDPELANDPLIFPSTEYTKNCTYEPVLAGPMGDRITKAFQQVITG